jgi:hypothetical protein
LSDQARSEKHEIRSVTPLARGSQRVAPGQRSPAAPAWPALLVILLLGIGLFALSDFLTREGTWHAISDSLVVGLIFAAMAGWVHVNRPALAQLDQNTSERSPLEIRYVASERHPLWHAEAKGRRRERVRSLGARVRRP